MPNKSIVLAALAAAPLACAQQIQATAEAPSKPVATVEVKAGADTLRRNDSASRIVVGHEELVKFGDATVLDALKRLPGVTVAGTGVRMRGLGSGYTQILVNGDRMPPGFDLEALSPEAIEKIEIVRAATAEYSTEAIAGTINIVLRKATGRNGAEIKLSGGGGPGTTAQGITLGKSGKQRDFGYTLGANLNHSTREYRQRERFSTLDAGGALTELRDTDTLYRQRFTPMNANARLNWALDAGGSLSWQTFYTAGRNRGVEDNRTTTLAGPAYPQPWLAAGWQIDSDTLRNELALDQRFDSGARLDAKVALNLSRVFRSMRRTGFRARDSNQEPVLDTLDQDRFREYEIITTGKYLVPLFEGHALAFGWDAGHDRNRQQNLRADRPLSTTPPLDIDTGFRATVDRLAVYGQDEWEVRAGWSVYLGARWEGVRTNTRGDAFAPVSASYSVFSPLMQTLWKIPGSKQDQLRFALTRTYRAPTMQQLIPAIFYASVNTEVSSDYTGNPGLRPELATGIDAAWEHYFSDGGLVSLSAASRAIHDFIRDETREEIGQSGARWITAPINQGGARVRSLALETKLPLKTIGIAWPLELRANISRNWSAVDAVPGPDNRLDRQPRWSGNLGADYTGQPLSAGASFNFVTGGWIRESIHESSYGGVTRDLEAYILYKLAADRQLRFTARNLLAPDRLRASRYADAQGVTARDAASATYRSLRLQFEQKFR
jgi:outer membrane receptor for ferrienterochelin and colicins